MNEEIKNQTKRIAVYLPINIYNGIINSAEAKGVPMSSEVKNILYAAIEGERHEKST